ncbi:MAG: methyltransferase domain-containing protein, partial [Planctomycetota bacterium]
ESRIAYDVEYENALHYSPTFQRYASELVDRLAREHDLAAKNILEIGCGSGEFLAELCDRAGAAGFGFDPAHDPARAAKPRNATVSIQRTSFSAAHARQAYDFLCARHVLEHIARPVDFLRRLRRWIDGEHRPAYYLEVPNVLYTLRDMGIWDIIYEHCSYFSPRSLARTVERAGCGVRRVLESYGGQFASVEGRLGGDDPPPMIPGESDDEIEGLVERFSEHYQAKQSEWTDRLSDLARRGERAAVWGAGSKGVTFLNATNAPLDVVPLVIDVNPRKAGRHVVGTGQRIVPPQELAGSDVDLVIVMNPNYLPEITARMRALGVAPPAVTP